MKSVVLALGLCVSLPVLASAADPPGDDGWIKLFDGHSLQGWKANEHAENWKVVDGSLVASGPRSHLFYVGDDPEHPAEFESFHLKAEVMTKPRANSGIYFHTRFQASGWPDFGHECQVNNSHGDPVRTGSLYNVVRNFQAPAKDNEWFTEEIIVQGKHIVIKVNDKTIVDYVEPDNVTGGRKLSKGTFALQAHDPGSTVMYRSLLVKRLEAP
jgi:hypothetical protein